MNSREKGQRAHALLVLGFAHDAEPGAAEITGAFRAACKLNHPDTTTDAMQNMADAVADGVDVDSPTRTTWTMDSLKGARDLLMRQIAAPSNNACVQCKGRGMVRAKMGSRPCGACNGTGDRHGSSPH